MGFLVDEVRGGRLFGIFRERSENGGSSSRFVVDEVRGRPALRNFLYEARVGLLQRDFWWTT
jgi:hypothetical protein